MVASLQICRRKGYQIRFTSPHIIHTHTTISNETSLKWPFGYFEMEIILKTAARRFVVAFFVFVCLNTEWLLKQLLFEIAKRYGGHSDKTPLKDFYGILHTFLDNGITQWCATYWDSAGLKYIATVGHFS